MRSDYLSHDEVYVITRALMPSNGVIVRVMLHTGLRVGDIVALRKDQIKRQFWITEAKTKKRRRVNLTDALIAEIMEQTQEGNPWAFPGAKPGSHRTRQAVWHDLKRAAKAFRVPANAAPHSLRKTYAVDLYAKTGDIKRVQRALGHENPEVTLIYAMADKLRTVPKTGHMR